MSEISVYTVRTGAFSGEEPARRACRELDRIRLGKADACKRNEDRVRSICCGLLLQYALRRYLKTEEKVEIRYAFGPYGKPYLPEYPRLQFSLSHSGGLVGAAFADREVGLDVQAVRPVRKIMARRIFSASEYDRYEHMVSCEEQTDWFFRCWCAKESYAKLTGEGLGTDFRRICFVPEHRCILPDGICMEDTPAPGYYLNVCTRRTEEAPHFGRTKDMTEELLRYFRLS